MEQKDKRYAENVCRVIRILPSDKREYLMGVADGMAAMAAVFGGSQTAQQTAHKGVRM